LSIENGQKGIIVTDIATTAGFVRGSQKKNEMVIVTHDSLVVLPYFPACKCHPKRLQLEVYTHPVNHGKKYINMLDGEMEEKNEMYSL
jgi:hypothetical protein